ncbi:MAG: ribosome hibernation-promoting factor, HPF/YfiA family [Armatimonadota bacterium]
MRLIFTGKSTSITDREREYAEKKFERLSRYFNSVREAHLTHSVQRNWQIVEVQVDLNGMIVRAEERTPDIFASIDAVAEKLEQQVKRLKGKLRNHKGKADAPTVAATLAELPTEEETEEAPTPPAVVRRKRFAIKPMTVDEASLQLDLLNHDFFLFLNDETGEVNALYRRRDGGLGLLEVET